MSSAGGIQLSTNGHDIPAELFGRLTEHTHLVDDGDALREAIARDGYVYLRGVLDRDEVLAARAEVFGRLAEVGEIAVPPEDGIATGTSRRDELQPDLGAFWQSVCEGPALRRVTHAGRMLEIMETLHGEPVRPFDFLWLRAMPPGKASAFHFDHVYMNRGTDRLHTVWTPLGPAPLTDGPLLIVENSHTWDDLIAEYRGLDVDRDTSRSGSMDVNPVELARTRGTRLISTDFEPGDILAMGMFTLHGSLDNRSPLNRVRLSSDTRYQPAGDPVDERFVGPNPLAHGQGYGGLSGSRPITAELLRR